MYIVTLGICQYINFSPFSTYHNIAKLKNGSEIVIHSPAQFPQKLDTAECLEPMVIATLTLPDKYLGKTIQLCMVGDCSIREALYLHSLFPFVGMLRYK